MATKRHGELPWLAELERLRAQRGASSDGKLLLDGLRLVEAAHTARLQVDRLIWTDAFASDLPRTRALVAALAAAGAAVHELDGRSFSRVSYKADGVVAVARYPSPPLETVLGARGTLVVLDGLSDPGNVGAVVRTANAWAAAGVVAVDGAAKLRHPKCVRASMGALFHTPVCGASRAELASRLAGRPVLVLAPDGEARWPADLLDHPSLVVVLGNERRGVHPALARLATHRIAIPMRGVVDSLNVSNAAAIVLWEVFRRRTS